MSAVAKIYQQSFDSHPYLTLTVVNALLSSLGDAVAQTSQILIAARSATHDPVPEYDLQRTGRFFVFGAGLGPIIGRWNKFLEFKFPLRASAGQPVSSIALAKRVVSDQLAMAPLGIAVFLGSMGVMEGRSQQQIAEKYRDLYKPALFANWKVWPLAQLINFRYMPLPYRVPFSQTCGVFWTLYLSLLNAREDTKQDTRIEMRRTLDGL